MASSKRSIIGGLEVKENYYALAVCILRKCTPEQAFELLITGKKKRTAKGEAMNDAAEMVRLREEQHMTYQAIGDLYGMNKDAVFRRIKRAKACAV
jgi:hypothetical protein